MNANYGLCTWKGLHPWWCPDYSHLHHMIHIKEHSIEHVAHTQYKQCEAGPETLRTERHRCCLDWGTAAAWLTEMFLNQWIQANWQKKTRICFLVQFSHNFTPKRNELRYHWCLSQLYFIGH
jgi:hypothetical protein